MSYIIKLDINPLNDFVTGLFEIGWVPVRTNSFVILMPETVAEVTAGFVSFAFTLEN